MSPGDIAAEENRIAEMVGQIEMDGALLLGEMSGLAEKLRRLADLDGCPTARDLRAREGCAGLADLLSPVQRRAADIAGRAASLAWNAEVALESEIALESEME